MDNSARERVRQAFQHITPDRTPVFEKLITAPSANAILGRPSAAVDFAYRMRLLELRDWAGLVEQEAQDLFELYHTLEFDMIPLAKNIAPCFYVPKRVGENKWIQGDVCVEYFPESNAIMRNPLPAGQTPTEFAELAEDNEENSLVVWRRVKELCKEATWHPAIYGRIISPKPATFGEERLMQFCDAPEKIHSMMRDFVLRADNTVEWLGREEADVVSFGGDVGSDRGPVISPDQYREFIAPYMKQVADKIKKAGMFCSIASDGNLWPIIDSFLVESGAEGYEEIDIAASMDLKTLKERFGKTICFIGNVDCRYVLPDGSNEEIEEAVIRCLEEGKGNGGHILMSSNSIHPGIRAEKLLAMLQAHQNYFGYKRHTPVSALKKRLCQNASM